MDWNDPSTYPSNNQKIDILLGSDLIYQSSIVPHLKKIVLELLNPTNGVFYYVAPDTGRDGLPQFIEELNQEGFDCVNHDMAPDWYRGNPLMNGDDDECFLHFHEMMGKNSRYILHEFRRGQTKEKSGSS
uniref:Calmodulin-lysine N-methyltransferase n=2 Tax=Proboscia inermis TaxID=420281 RepID=A0A7S0C0Y0_9STRA|mmetsp:Transcript_20202/g.20471  ORF Transcript_20202/g.20471 Transcript_20202/m.20471 type:complete len:130 (+) Transcript_20202:446-835(+)